MKSSMPGQVTSHVKRSQYQLNCAYKGHEYMFNGEFYISNSGEGHARCDHKGQFKLCSGEGLVSQVKRLNYKNEILAPKWCLSDAARHEPAEAGRGSL